ncbi:hypothetical protein ACW9KT_15470 [Hymenobacter sp. HD11105]
MSASLSFLPTNYEAPKPAGGNYTKLQDGENRLRILSNPVIGWVYWSTDNKPVRSALNPGACPADMRAGDNNGRTERPKEFWAMKVYNYGTQEMQILEVTQTQIKNALAELSRDEDWGHPKNYDLKIGKSGKGLETKYAVTPVVPKPVSEEVKTAFNATPITLDALLNGGDPFGAVEQSMASPSGQAPLPRESAKPKAQPAPKPAPVAVEEGDEQLPF